MNTFFKELFGYNTHFNQKLAEVFLAYPYQTTENSVKLFNHILNAHQIWNGRIEPNQNFFGVWEIHPPKDYAEIEKESYENSIRIIDKFDLEETIQYSNSKGRVFNNSIRDILFHVINHSTYHRGQIVTMLRQVGFTDVGSTDMLGFYR